MFVRYRKLVSDGREPLGVSAGRNCPGMCRSRYPSRDGVCPKKPRCRWRIGLLGLADPLVPYRLHVSLAENRREGNRVRQEHIADLGTVDGYLLPEFWEGLDPAISVQLRKDNWDLWSVKARVAFWENAKPRLDRLSHRLDPQAIRMAIHRRIPWPMQHERALAEARQDFSEWRGLERLETRFIEIEEEHIAATLASSNKKIAELTKSRNVSRAQVPRATGRLATLRS